MDIWIVILFKSLSLHNLPRFLKFDLSSYQQSQSEEEDTGNMNSKFIINIPTQQQ